MPPLSKHFRASNRCFHAPSLHHQNASARQSLYTTKGASATITRGFRASTQNAPPHQPKHAHVILPLENLRR